MEIFLLITLAFIYIITVVTGKKVWVERIWTAAFLAACFLLTVALFCLRFTHQDVLMTADQFNWYYFLYLFSALTLSVGAINLWLYRRQLWRIFFNTDEESKE